MSEDVTTFLIMGASGDLTQRLLLPGLGTWLSVEPKSKVRVVGVDRTELSEQEWRERIMDAFADAEAGEDLAKATADNATYVTADVLDRDGIARVLEQASAPLVIYFALPPQVTTKVCALLEEVGLPPDTRLALEKPFGNDAQSAAALNEQLLRLVPESQIHRIDHFLGVNSVLNIIGARFANRVLAPIWSAEHLERVDITYDETLALEGRAGYYDKAGALVDMIQSHLLQVLSIVGMEAPARMEAEEVRSLKSLVLRNTELWGDSPTTASRRARYTAGVTQGKSVPDYVSEEGVDPDNETETAAEIVVEVRNARWKGVPFVLRSGKAMDEVRKQIVLTFKPPAHVPEGLTGGHLRDQVILELKPGAITINMAVNAPGDPFDLEHQELHAELGRPRMLPYGEVIGGILQGNPLLSIRGDNAEECWRIITPVMEAWEAGEVPLEEYAAGTAGPEGWGVVPSRSPDA